ncbi:MAG: hypothetical protein [Olavius algarvensis Gamma 1 endosymbiont]|nr:MAG: hypothetical protein [Olavius algarvensis Gamma 1 endosymbiont]
MRRQWIHSRRFARFVVFRFHILCTDVRVPGFDRSYTFEAPHKFFDAVRVTCPASMMRFVALTVSYRSYSAGNW